MAAPSQRRLPSAVSLRSAHTWKESNTFNVVRAWKNGTPRRQEHKCADKHSGVPKDCVRAGNRKERGQKINIK